jgi:hypothetical protein
MLDNICGITVAVLAGTTVDDGTTCEASANPNSEINLV